MVHFQRPATLPARSRPANSTAESTVWPRRRLSAISHVQSLSFGLSVLVHERLNLVSQGKFCCAISRQRLNPTLTAHSKFDFISRCLCLQAEPDFSEAQDCSLSGH